MSIEKERIARCVGWLEGFSTTVWALLATNDGSRLVDASAGEEYEATVRMLREALYAPKCGIVDPMQDAPRPKVTYETVGEWHGPVTVTMKSCGDAAELQAENAKLRELVRTFYHCTTSGECDECPINSGGPVHLMPDTICDTIHDRMRELGVDA